MRGPEAADAAGALAGISGRKLRNVNRVARAVPGRLADVAEGRYELRWGELLGPVGAGERTDAVFAQRAGTGVYVEGTRERGLVRLSTYNMSQQLGISRPQSGTGAAPGQAGWPTRASRWPSCGLLVPRAGRYRGVREQRQS